MKHFLKILFFFVILNPSLLLAVVVWDGTTATSFGSQALNAGENESNPILISTPAQLKYLATLVSNSAQITADLWKGKCYKMTDDFDLNSLSFSRIGIGAGNVSTYDTNSASRPFTGVFDGAGHSISNLSISVSGSFVALFPYLSRATVKNLKLKSGNTSGINQVGGLISIADNATVINCQSNLSVYSTGINSGGLVACAFGNSNILSCSNSGRISSTTTNVNCLGGLIGQSGKTDGTSLVSVINSYNSGNVIGVNGNVGGLIGYSENLILTKSFNASDSVLINPSVTTNNYIGGLIGRVKRNATISQCFNVGMICSLGNATMSNFIGGICGSAEYTYSGSIITINDCYNAGCLITNTGSLKYFGGISSVVNGVTLNRCLNTGALFTGIEPSSSSMSGISYNVSASTFNDCYYDSNFILSPTNSIGTGIITDNLTNGTLPMYFADTIWTASANMYPRLKALKDSAASIVSAMPVYFSNNEKYSGVSSPFFLGTGSSVTSYLEDYYTLSDPRFNISGTMMYKNNYMDQPYIVKISSTQWFCVVTNLDGTKFTYGDGGIGLNIIALLSEDQGKTWTRIANIEPSDPEFFMAWGVPYITSFGRIYVLYEKISLNNKNTIPVQYCYRYSDNHGYTWSERFVLPYRKTTIDFENDTQGVSYAGWSVASPIRVNNELYFIFTKTGKTYDYSKSTAKVGEGFIYHCANIETEQDPTKLTWTMLPDGETGISHPVDQNGFTGVQEEHQLVSLGENNIYSVFRTKDLFLPSSYSSDLGRTWTIPQFETYYNGRKIRHNRACAKLYKTNAGKYLLWFNNHSIEHTLGRDPIWISGGVLENGKIVWSQPEILLYTDPRTFADGLLGSGTTGLSYPDFVEADGKFWVTETDKAVSRIHQIDKTLLEDLFNQRTKNTLETNGLAIDKRNISSAGETISLPILPSLKFGGITLEFSFTISSLLNNQMLFDSRDANGRGIVVKTILNGTITEAMSNKTYSIRNTIGITINDGNNNVTWYADNHSLIATTKTHLAFVIDGAANVLSVLVNGNLCDRSAVVGDDAGWIRFSNQLHDVSTSSAKIGSSNINIDQFRLYNRYLRTSEVISNFNSL